MGKRKWGGGGAAGRRCSTFAEVFPPRLAAVGPAAHEAAVQQAAGDGVLAKELHR